MTAVDRADAENLFRTEIGTRERTASIAEVTEDIDVKTLDPEHVVPSMGDVTVRSIWWPRH